MHSNLGINNTLIFPLGAVLLFLLASGCGGGYGSTPVQSPSGNSVPSRQGSWEIIFHSSVDPTNYTVLETNLTQAGSHVFAGPPGALLLQGMVKIPPTSTVQLSQLGGRCDSNSAGQVTFDANITNPTATDERLTFFLTDTGSLGSSTTTASFSTNGNQVSGNYFTPAACGFPDDRGTFTGYQSALAFVDNFSGSLNGGADVVAVIVESVSNTFQLTFSGTDNGAPLALHGSSTGFFVELKGTVAGQPLPGWLCTNPITTISRSSIPTQSSLAC